MKYNIFFNFGILFVILIVSSACVTQQSTMAAYNIDSATELNAENGAGDEVTDAKVWPDAAKYDKPIAFAQTQREKLMLREINMVRANPKAYVEFVQEFIRLEERGRTIPRVPTVTVSKSTRNGVTKVKRDTTWSGGGVDKSHINKKAVAAAKELIGVLQKMQPVGMLTAKECLTKSAKDHGLYCKSTGKMSHTGRGGKDLDKRLPAFCGTLPIGGENLCAGSVSVRQSLLQLLVDTNIPDRGHRKTLLNPVFKNVGVYETGAFGGFTTGWVQEFGG